MNEHNTVEAFQPALFPLSAVQTSGYAQPDQDDTEAESDENPDQLTFDDAGAGEAA